MHLESLSLRDFRNVAQADIELHSRLNVFAGDNGQGKTNLIEAIYWLATLRPSRAGRLRELIRWGAAACHGAGRVEDRGLVHRLACGLEGEDRAAWREGKRVRAEAYFGALAVVLFSPEEVGLVRGPPADRRRFLDRAIFTGRPAYLADVLAHRRALDGRNRLLREGAEEALLEAYEGPLARLGARLLEARSAWMASVAPRFRAIFGRVMGEDLPVGLRYRTTVDLDPGDDPATALASALAADRVRDRERGFTQRGPQADDLGLELFGRPARLYASQGQQRALVLALKIAEIEVLTERLGVVPVLLLDDVSSELDPARNERLFDFLEGFPGQVVVTTTDPTVLRLGAQRRTWWLSAGQPRLEEDRGGEVRHPGPAAPGGGGDPERQQERGLAGGGGDAAHG